MKIVGAIISLVLLVLSACAPEIGSTQAYILVCTAASDYGAVPDDGLDDRAALQNAINAAQTGSGCVELDAGKYQVTRRPESGTANIPSLKITAPLIFRGQGAASTTVAMMGSGIRPGATSPNDWWLFGIYGDNVTIEDMTLDGAERTNTSEQTHLVQVNSAENIILEGLHFNFPSIGPSSGGDCMRLLGTSTDWVRNVTIRDNVGQICDRSFLGVQRGVDGVRFYNNTSYNVGDQAVDFEPSCGTAFPSACVLNVLMQHNSLARGVNAQGNNTVTIAGDGSSVAKNIRLEDTVIQDGGVFILDAHDVTLANLSVSNRVGSSEPPIHAKKRIERLRLINVVAERIAGSTAGSVVKVTEQSGAVPTDVTLLGCTILQNASGVPVYGEGLKYLTVVDTDIIYNGPADPSVNAVRTRGLSVPTSGPVLVDTFITGLTSAAAAVGLTDGTLPTLVRVTMQ